ncbi:MAG: hypothetical protein K2O24_05095 [Muribaculaceae bacterium]|nr:hypothetical protein [Muribaculaceae bacterium]
MRGPCALVALLRIILLCLVMLMAPVNMRAEVTDRASAMEYCDTSPLDPVEGIWEYPEDGVTVLVRRSAAQTGRYDIIALDSEDTRIAPGDVIGRLEATPDIRQFKLTLFTRARSGTLSSPEECLATLSADSESLFVKTRKIKISFNPSLLLPRFWRIARLRIKDPLENLPAGMIKVYPSYDGNGSSRRRPRYL